MKEAIFEYFCKLTACNVSSTFPTRFVVQEFGISMYKARKYIKELVDDGLLVRSFETIDYDPEEPTGMLRGFCLTRKGMESEVYKKEEKRISDYFNQMFRNKEVVEE